MHRTPTSGCPVCGTTLDAASGIATARAPEPGDVSVCLYCGTMLTWAEDMALVQIDPTTWAEIQRDKPALAAMLLQASRANLRKKH